MVQNDPKRFKDGSKMVKNDQKMILKWSISGQKWSKNVSIMVQKWFKMVQKWFENGPKMDHQVDLSAKGSYIITHIVPKARRLIHRSINLTISKLN